MLLKGGCCDTVGTDSRKLSSVLETTRMLLGLPVLSDGYSPCELGWKGVEGIRTTIGVGALELALDGVGADGSPNIVSRNICADITCASLGSEAAMVACSELVAFGSRMLFEIERYRTSRASCVRPRWDLEPSIV
jgi:hypothetical protein